jgi:hypothetical protein
MSYAVTIRKTDGTIVNTSTNAYPSGLRPNVDDYVQITVGGVASYYKVGWVAFRNDPLAGPQVTIGAALPSDPSPPPPT